MKRWWLFGLALALTFVLVGGEFWHWQRLDRQRTPDAAWTESRVATPATYQLPVGQDAEVRPNRGALIPQDDGTLRYVEEADVPLDERGLQGYLRGYQTAAEGSDQRAEMRAEIERWLSTQYDQHLSRHVQQVEELETRVARLRQQLERRQAAKARLVELRLELMLSQADGLGWPDDPSDSSVNPFVQRPTRVLPGPMPYGLGPGGQGGPNYGTPMLPAGGTLPADGGNANSGNPFGTSLPGPPAFDRQGYSVPSEVARPYADGLPAFGQANKPLSESELLELFPQPQPQRRSSSNSPFMTDQDSVSQALKHTLLAVHNYHDVYQKLPFRHHAADDPQDHNDLSWLVRVLPYIDVHLAELFSQFDMSQSWDSPQNRPLLEKMPAILGQGTQTQLRWVPSYVENFRDITDGLSNTIALIHGGPPINWTENKPLSQLETLELFLSLAPGQELIVGMYDGSIRRLTRDNTSEATFEAMLTPNGGER